MIYIYMQYQRVLLWIPHISNVTTIIMQYLSLPLIRLDYIMHTTFIFSLFFYHFNSFVILPIDKICTYVFSFLCMRHCCIKNIIFLFQSLSLTAMFIPRRLHCAKERILACYVQI